MIYTVLIPNLIAVVLLLVLLFSVGSIPYHEQLADSKIFKIMLICNLFQCVGEIAAYQLDGIMYPGFRMLILLTNSALFIVNIMFAFLWVVYADYKIYEDIHRTCRRAKTLIVPALIIAAGAVINLFVPVFYRINQFNVYQRTPLFIIPYVVTYVYLLYGTIFIYRYKNQARSYVFLPAVLFMMPILLGSVLQFLFYGVSTVWIGVAISLVSVYVNMQNEVSYTDTLSGLYTRVYMYQFLMNAIIKKDNGMMAGIMIDIDDFKNINDTYGHLTGDDAIRVVGRILRSTIPEGSIAARYGGDEFIVLQRVSSEEDIYRTIRAIEQAEADFEQSNSREYSLKFSKGHTVFDPVTDTVDTFLDRMDRAMYDAKKLRQNNELNK